MRLAFVGLGNIGSGAAACLVRAGRSVTVADLDAGRVHSLVELGATGAATAAEAVAGCDVVFSSLPGPAQIRAVGDQIVPAMSPGSIWVEMSTNDLVTARSLAVQAGDRSIALIDAPVSGGPEGAAAGTLSIFVGGQTSPVDRVMPFLLDMGTKVDHLGDHGAGIVAKIAQVTLCYTQTITLIEALLLGVKGGVEPARMLDVIQHSAGTSYSAMTYGPEILAGTYDASFPISHAAKDMRLAMELADSLGAELPLTRHVAELYAETEAVFGPDAAHCLAAQLVERRNDMILHELETTP